MIERFLDWVMSRLMLRRSVHYYISTACLHGDHEYCVAPSVSREGRWERLGPSYSSDRDEPKTPASCKFCEALCRCSCHRKVKP